MVKYGKHALHMKMTRYYFFVTIGECFFKLFIGMGFTHLLQVIISKHEELLNQIEPCH
jgi:hypothetical protein